MIGMSYEDPKFPRKLPEEALWYTLEEIEKCIEVLIERGVDVDTIDGDKTIGYLFELLERVRPH